MSEVMFYDSDSIDTAHIPVSRKEIPKFAKNSQPKSILRSHNANHHYYNFKTGVTVVSRHKDGKTYIGIAKCGNDDKKDPELGYEIALHRTYVKPYSIIGEKLEKSEFRSLSKVLNYHVYNNSQWSQKALDRIDV